jgi:hypothetical protein
MSTAHQLCFRMMRQAKFTQRFHRLKHTANARLGGFHQTALLTRGALVSHKASELPFGIQKLVGKPCVRFGSSWELHPRHGQEETNTILAFAAKKLECGDAVEHFVTELSPEATDSLLKSLLLKARNDVHTHESEKIFSKLDANQDGVLSKEEFLRLASAAAEERAQPIEPPTYRQVVFAVIEDCACCAPRHN